MMVIMVMVRGEDDLYNEYCEGDGDDDDDDDDDDGCC